MILGTTDVEKLTELITLARVIGVESLIIDKESVRGQSEDGVFIIANHDIDQFKETPIGISRLSVLFSRLNLMSNGGKVPSVELELKERDNGEKIVLRLNLKSGKTKIDFKCADPQLIKAKRILKDALIFSFDVDEDTIDLMIKSNSAMQTDRIKIILDQGKIYFNINDTEGDSLKHLVTEQVEVSDPSKDKFLINLKHKIVLPLFKLALKEKTKLNIKVSEIRNVLSFDLQGTTIYVMPEVLNANNK